VKINKPQGCDDSKNQEEKTVSISKIMDLQFKKTGKSMQQLFPVFCW